ncbi:DNA repair protein RecN [Arenimonas fontis]|uniref:DNA repair protein RecN n=1 Tax=Arenimonas fontis TaxID=2608255 RepID=A0A5B2ZFS4_9GAMM|nr:DNA repair protein RecN [Arenimonas fontis]KAA2286054.1 DNA repair protein RecN [Arenimonas fontis]
MLVHLSLRDFAVVSRAELAFGPGMTVVSGETGAGKSLLVDALMWLTGARADAGIVRHGAERAELTAEFRLDDAPEALSWLRENELDDGEGCQLRRVIRADGGSRAWINGRPATLGQLAELGGRLVEIHGQHEHQALLDRGQQLALLDAFGRHEALLATVQEAARRWSALERERQQLDQAGDVADRLAWLEHQLAELDAERLEAEALEELGAAHRRQANAAGLLEGCGHALARLAGDEGPSVARLLHQVAADLGRLAGDEPRLAEVLALVESAGIQVAEAASGLERVRDGLDLDPERLRALEDRLARLHDLARKHRVPLAGLAARREALRAEHQGLAGAGERAEHLAREATAAMADWRRAAAELGKARHKAAEALGAAVASLMAELGMAGGRFEVALEPLEDGRPSPQGGERCEFLVSANPGQPPRPMRKVASGGELARISLAIEVAALGLDSVPTMVFDEVDTGIGGAVAEVVGQKLRTLGAERQVLCVTHLPQVAAQGHHHFQVSKSVAGDSTHSQVAALDEAGRIEELARMLGGVEITREVRANAKQLLSRARRG